MQSIIDYLEHWTAIHPDKRFSSFLDVHGNDLETYTYATFNARSRYIAEYLFQMAGIRRGDRVLLAYSSGLEGFVAFVACARIGAIPVVVYPPRPGEFERSLANLAFISRNCDAHIALTTR